MNDLRDHELAGSRWQHQTIDPVYGLDERQSGWDAESGPYIKPWYAVLSACGNHGIVMILDTKTCLSHQAIYYTF
jgi:hypothetical protein